MKTTKKTPPIVQIGLWLVSLLVFAIGFWHTHLGLKEFKVFDPEYGSLVVATIVLIFLLTTYWFAINGKKLALVFYIVCGFIFFILNLNYFYPSYMARTIIQSEAKALVDTLDSYSTVKLNSKNDEPFADFKRLESKKAQFLNEVYSKGCGPQAKKLLQEYNVILKKYNIDEIPLEATYCKVTSNSNEMAKQAKDFEGLLQTALNTFESRSLGVTNEKLFNAGMESLKLLQEEFKEKLQLIATDNDTEYNLDTISKYENVRTIVQFVTKLNGNIESINKSMKNPILVALDKDTHPRADKLGRIKYTLLSIKERISEIDTWAVIFFCLFIDLIIPLGIYLLLRKKEDEEESEWNLRRKKKPVSL